MKCGLMIDTWHCLSSFRCQIETGKSVETMTTFIEVNTLAGIMMSYRCFVQSLINILWLPVNQDLMKGVPTLSLTPAL